MKRVSAATGSPPASEQPRGCLGGHLRLQMLKGMSLVGWGKKSKIANKTLKLGETCDRVAC